MKQATLQRAERPLTIVFDLGGVLIDWNPEYLYRKMFAGDEAGMHYFLNNVCTPAWNVQQDAGRPFAEAIAERIERFPEFEPYIRAFRDRWIEMIGGPIEGTVATLAALREDGYALNALSNWSAETFPEAEARFAFLDWFDDIVLSGAEKVIKPDPAIYEILLRRSGRAARHCLFIDDAAPNIAMADQLGFQTIHFLSPEQLSGELRARRLL